MFVVLREVTGNAQKARPRPLDTISGFLPQLLQHHQLKFPFVVKQPVEIEESLVNDVLVEGTFVLNDDRATVFIDSERVDSAAMLCAGGIFRRQEPNTQERVQMSLDQGLKGFLNCY